MCKQVNKKLATSEDPTENFHLIDIIQRLGIEHYFAEEIKVALEKQFLILSSNPIDFVSSHELYEVALAFRLLRQGGHYVNAGWLYSLWSVSVSIVKLADMLPYVGLRVQTQDFPLIHFKG